MVLTAARHTQSVYTTSKLLWYNGILGYSAIANEIIRGCKTSHISWLEPKPHSVSTRYPQPMAISPALPQNPSFCPVRFELGHDDTFPPEVLLFLWIQLLSRETAFSAWALCFFLNSFAFHNKLFSQSDHDSHSTASLGTPQSSQDRLFYLLEHHISCSPPLSVICIYK